MDEVTECEDPFRLVVEGGDEGELFAPSSEKLLAVLNVNLMKSLNAVGDEGGREDQDPLFARLEDVAKIGLQPRVAAEAGLEADGVVVGREI